MEETKRCSACGEELPLSAFYKRTQEKDGLDYYCKECRREIRASVPRKVTEFMTSDRNVECYLAKARKLLRGEVVDPHCELLGEGD